MIRAVGCCLLLFSCAANASVFGDYLRGGNVPDTYPAHLSIARFDQVAVGELLCDWRNAGSFELKTDRGNIDLSSYLIAPNAIKVSCSGMEPFFVFSLPPRFLGSNAKEGDIGVWFGVQKDRYGCEGYIGCDKVHVLETYHQAGGDIQGKDAELKRW